MRGMDLEKLKTLVNVADVGSLSMAAKLHNTHQSLVSRQISALERDWGERVFHRTGRGVALTEFGQRVIPGVRALVLESERLAADIRGNDDNLAADVGIGVHGSMVHPLVSRIYKAVRELSTGIKLQIHEGSVSQLEQWLAGGQVDIAIHYSYRDRFSDPTAVLARTPLFLVGPAGDALTARPHVQFSELGGLPLVLPSFRCAVRPYIEQMASKHHVALRTVAEAETLLTLKEVVTHSGVYGIFNDGAVDAEISRGLLQMTPIVNPTPEASVVLSVTTHHPLPRTSRLVAQLVRRTFLSGRHTEV